MRLVIHITRFYTFIKVVKIFNFNSYYNELNDYLQSSLKKAPVKSPREKSPLEDAKESPFGQSMLRKTKK